MRAAEAGSAPDGQRFDIVAIAASAGGMNALRSVLGSLRADFPAAIVVVQHLDPRHRSMLADILGRHCELAVTEAEAGEPVLPGHVYIAPPNRHLLVTSDGALALSESELVHFVRPSADLLFESVAGSHAERVIAVVLTGTGHDGSTGVRAVKNMGGVVIAQDQESSEFFGMPGRAIATGVVDSVLPLADIGPELARLVGTGERP